MKISVIRSTVIDAPVDRVWAVLRDFNSHARWHPLVDQSRMENEIDGDVVGGVRSYSIDDGKELREQLLQHSDSDYTFTYCILDSSLPLFDYVATARLKPVTDGNRTFWDWHAQFRVSDDKATELEEFVGQQIYAKGFAGLQKHLAEQAVSPPVTASEKTAPVVATPGGEILPSRVVVAAATGGPEVMSLQDMTVSAPGPRQVRIRQTVVAVNFLDLMQRKGISEDIDLPWTPGMEGVGEIIDVGAQVNGLFPGDRVAYMCQTSGAYADIRCIDADACLPLPDGVSDIDASTLLKGVTAGLLLSRVFRVVPGGTIMIQGVSGGIGHLLSQWAKGMDLRVMGTVSTAEKARFIRDRGCDYPIVIAQDVSLKEEVMRISSGHGVDYWVHTGGVHELDTAIACLSRCGHCAVVGDRKGQPTPLDIEVLKRRSLSVSAPVCFDYFDDKTYLHRLSHQLFAKIQNRELIPAIESFPLRQAAEAHKWIESRQNMGAVVLIPSE